MTTIRLKGGLGNQMFQYAYGRNLELSRQKIVFDTSFFEGHKAKIDTARNFKLNNFNIETKAEFSNKHNQFQILWNKIQRYLGIETNEFNQNEKYFKNIETDIHREFTLKKPLGPVSLGWENKIKSTPVSVSIHVRRGDYVKNHNMNAYHGICDANYYQKSYAEITKRLETVFEIFVFSDDIEWAEENLKLPSPIHFVSNPNIPDYEELILMSRCGHNIIANSSFSWWGAWLNQNPNKIVIAPKQWFANPIANKNQSIVPDSWIKI